LGLKNGHTIITEVFRIYIIGTLYLNFISKNSNLFYTYKVLNYVIKTFNLKSGY